MAGEFGVARGAPRVVDLEDLLSPVEVLVVNWARGAPRRRLADDGFGGGLGRRGERRRRQLLARDGARSASSCGVSCCSGRRELLQWTT